MSSQAGQIDNVMKEERVFPPPPPFAAKARIRSVAEYDDSAARRPKTWKASGADGRELHWFEPFRNVLQWEEPLAQWFVGGKTNVSYNCLDIHLDDPAAEKAALIWEGEPGDTRVLTYQMLHDEVCRFANVLKKLGVGRGDVVSIYMPLVPELAIAMLACARIGAIHA